MFRTIECHFQDRLAPSTITTEFDNVRFNALFAFDDDKADDLVNNAGADGFRLDSEPLFKVCIDITSTLFVLSKLVLVIALHL